jgi:hypothetical protein
MTSIPLGMEVADTRLKLVRPIARPISVQWQYSIEQWPYWKLVTEHRSLFWWT